MAFHIKKLNSVIELGREIYYCGGQRWSDRFEDRKVYDTEEAATSELYRYGGSVNAE